MILFHQRKTLLGRMINLSVPLLNRFRKGIPFHHTLDQLRQLPRDTWGYCTAAFLDREGYGFLPNYEQHDALHTLLGYDTSTEGELRVQAFMVGNGTASFAGRCLFLLGRLLVPELDRDLRPHVHRGRNSEPVDWQQISSLMVVPIESVRQRVAPSPPEADFS
jgi:ubiquinone biosynthesis protein Coq4